MNLDLRITTKQNEFINSDAFETLFGGAAGGGKSYGQVIDAELFAIQYPGSKQIIFRRTFPDLERSIIRLSLEIYPKQLAKYNQSKHVWTFMNGSIIEFGYIDNENDKGAYALGIHLEGPFISKKHKGAQVESCIIPCSVETFKVFEEASNNHIKEVTLAYEENGKELSNYLYNKGIVASLGHTDATSKQVLEAAENGVTSATHTYNAMKGLHHREAGTVGGVLLCDNIYSELICDLVHVSPEAIKVLYKNKGQDKITLVTDAMESKHLPDGIYKLGGQDVIVKGKEARLADGTLAGSTLKMNDAIKNMQGVIGLSMEKAIDLATINPARVLSIADKKGSIAVGKDADFAVIDKDFNVYMTVVNGKVLYQK